MKKKLFYLPTYYLEGRVAKEETNNFLRLAWFKYKQYKFNQKTLMELFTLNVQEINLHGKIFKHIFSEHALTLFYFSAGINAYCMLLEKIGIDVTYKGR